ncbi:uncharacterized protein LOC130935931 isoform X2 [Arachis stenosperma]|uniref:uncharacterized protein LOC130935931 isoform X2 n=1 Tax=Arachis stenosperma TaxID=217475 RepID=UPI0025AC5E2B|nr:uncharacterized protein LOC130935931 isoform X2 [Arachis stenosperma]
MGQRLLVCLGGTKFAECFFCKQQGHLSKNCPQNAHGIYPKGGYCKICGGVTHSARDCSEKGKKAPFAANGPADGYTIGLSSTSSTGLASKDSNYLVFVKEESVEKLSRKHRRNEVFINSMIILAEVELRRCITPIIYVTKFTAIPVMILISFVLILYSIMSVD